MGLIDLFQKTRETSMELKPQGEETTNKVVTCKGCGAELKAYAYGKNLYVCPQKWLKENGNQLSNLCVAIRGGK